VKNPSIIAIGNQKGGVAKTTTIVNLASAYAQLGKKVLVVDMDYQGDSTCLLGVRDIVRNDFTKTVPYAIQNDLTLKDIRIPSNIENVDILATTRVLDELNNQLVGKPKQLKVVELLLECDELYDYDIILIDTHPSLDAIFKASIAASHYCLIPIFAESESSEGLAHMISEIEGISKYLNRSLHFLGCLITKYDVRNTTHVKFEKLLRETAKRGNFNIFKTVIPISTAVASASAVQLPLNVYKKSLNVSIAYETLAKELLPELIGKRPEKKKVNIPQVQKIEDSEDEQIDI